MQMYGPPPDGRQVEVLNGVAAVALAAVQESIGSVWATGSGLGGAEPLGLAQTHLEAGEEDGKPELGELWPAIRARLTNQPQGCLHPPLSPCC